MKHVYVPVALLALAFTASARAIPGFHYQASNLSSSSQIVLPAGMNSVVKAVNVGSTVADTVNGITFEADTGNWSLPGPFTGNGYTATGSLEGAGSGSLAGAAFTASTINIDGAGSGGVFTGTTFTGLTANTDYVFQLFLTDLNSGRGAHFSYAIEDFSGTHNITQDLGTVNLYQISFNSRSSTTFEWSLTPIDDFHDAKISGFAFYSAASAIPEPSTYAVIAGALALGLAAWRRSRRISDL